MTIRDRAKVVVPPCPVCAAPITVNWVDIRAVGDQRAAWVPGPIKCSANEDHDVRPVMATTGEWARERDDFIARCAPAPVVMVPGAKGRSVFNYDDLPTRLPGDGMERFARVAREVARRPEPRSPIANALEAAGAIAILIGAVATVGVFIAWLDIGQWVPAIYVGGAVTFSVLLLGVAMSGFGYRWNQRCHQRWQEWRP